jgi:hypothetical protein
MLQRWKVDVVAYGPSLHDQDSYFLMRAFDGIEARQAVEGCRRGRIREGIAVLERKLRAQGFRS